MKKLSWDEYFGLIAIVVSLRSGDAETAIGAVIVDDKNRIISTGYNGSPIGTSLPNTRPQKYPYMVHAETNAILFSHRALDNCKLYVTSMLPCDACARNICQVGINEVIIVNQIYISEEKHNKWGFPATLEMFEQCGIKQRSIKVSHIKLEEVDSSKCSCWRCLGLEKDPYEESN